MAREVETFVKLKGVEAGTVVGFFEQRLKDIFGNFSRKQLNDRTSQYVTKSFIKPYGVKAALNIEQVGEGEVLAKLSGRPCITIFGMIAAAAFIVFLLTAVAGIWASIIPAIIFLVALLLEQKKTRKRLESLLGELNVRFS